MRCTAAKEKRKFQTLQRESTCYDFDPSRQVLNSRRDCNVCSLPGKPFSVSTSEWDDHQKSRVHQRALWRKQGGKEKEREEQIAMRDVRRAEREKLRQAKEADNIAAESC